MCCPYTAPHNTNTNTSSGPTRLPSYLSVHWLQPFTYGHVTLGWGPSIPIPFPSPFSPYPISFFLFFPPVLSSFLQETRLSIVHKMWGYQATCTPCAAGTYANTTGSSSCLNCPSGATYTNKYTNTNTKTNTNTSSVPSFFPSFLSLITALHIWPCYPRVGSFILHMLSAYISFPFPFLPSPLSIFLVSLFSHLSPLSPPLLSSELLSIFHTNLLICNVLFRWVDSVSFISSSLYWTGFHSSTQQSLTSHHLHPSYPSVCQPASLSVGCSALYVIISTINLNQSI